MAEQQNVINTRIQLKYDTWNKWQSASFTPLAGEICIVRFGDTEDGGLANEEGNILFKVGDGTTNFKSLPWASALAADVYDWAKAESVRVNGKSIEFYTTIGENNSRVIHSVDLNYLTPEEIADITGSLSNLSTTDKTSLVGAINEVHAIASQVKEVVYVNDTEVTTPEDDTVNVISNLIVDNSNNKYTFTEETTQVATAQAFTYSNPEPPINTVGGINPGTVMNNITFKQFVEQMLYPYTPPVVEKPSITISKSNKGSTTVYEKGEKPTISNVSVTVTKKSKPISKVELLKNDNSTGTTVTTVVEIKTDNVASGGTFNFARNDVISSNTTYQVRATDETNTEDGTTTSSASDGQSFVYPYYYGVCSDNQKLDEAFIESLTKDVWVKGTKTYTYNTNNQCMVIAYPAAYGELQSAKDLNNFENIADFTRTSVIITGLDSTAQSYYVYKNKPSTNTGFKITFAY